MRLLNSIVLSVLIVYLCRVYSGQSGMNLIGNTVVAILVILFFRGIYYMNRRFKK